jgi:hemolysin activation/secretion protein
MQPNLGGPDTLRGFRPYRFTGPNAMWMNAEYRWETSAALDLVLFADGGKVFDRWERLNVHDLQGSGGFGLRFKVRHDLAFRFDTGFSHEGVQLWLRFNNAF